MALVGLLPAFMSLADPSPTYIPIELTFTLEYEIEEEPILAAELWECYSPESECSWTEIHSPDVWRGRNSIACVDNLCRGAVTFAAFFFQFDSAYYRLRIEYPDRLRVSNTFYIDTMHPGGFSVVVREDDLVVTPKYLIHPLTQRCFFLPMLGVTIIIEVAIANAISRRRKIHRVPGRVAIANLITLPVVWFLLPAIGLSAAFTVLLSEVFAVAFEALFIRFTRSEWDGRNSLMLSLGTNAASFLLGLVTLGILSFL